VCDVVLVLPMQNEGQGAFGPSCRFVRRLGLAQNQNTAPVGILILA
jgi:2-oxoglutarate dehydrogenase complex dehydrogenase (E1) component-like enzyme